jgi:hypothetical protein
MTIQDLYDWAKEKNLLNVQIAKNANLEIEYIERVHYLTEEYVNYLTEKHTKIQPMVVCD